MNTSTSLLGNIWKHIDFDERQLLMISQRHNISLLLAKLLYTRNISDHDIEIFLDPDLNNNLPDPFLLKDMRKSVKRVYEGLLKNELIGIIADYDVDGSTSAALLCKFFKSVNQEIILKIPNRLKDGFGPNLRIMDQLLEEKINLLFTLDCGTSSFNTLSQKRYNNIDIIIIDHHISEQNLPKVYSIINPNRFDENSTFKDLAAVGVTFLFLLALRKHLRENNFFKIKKIKEPNLLSYLDLVALGTVCDVVKLINFNRSFVNKGMDIIHKRFNKGIAKIIDNSRIYHSPTVTDLGYVIGPQLNAASRIDDSSLASKILITEDLIEIESISRKLLILNDKRKLIEQKVYEEAIDQVIKQIHQNVIIVKGEAWHSGVLGIVASRIVEKYYKPTIVISFNQKFGLGSARSISNIDLGKIILNLKKEGLILNGGGHKMAAGFKISKDLFKKFEIYLINFFNTFDSSYFQKINFYDCELSLEEINVDLIDNIEKLEPFGNGNPQPKFIIKNTVIEYAKSIKEKHVLLNFKNNYSKNIKGICFNCIDNQLGENLLKSNSKNFDIACSIQRDNYHGNILPQIIVHDAILNNN